MRFGKHRQLTESTPDNPLLLSRTVLDDGNRGFRWPAVGNEVAGQIGKAPDGHIYSQCLPVPRQRCPVESIDRILAVPGHQHD